jgi:hypothetical protein
MTANNLINISSFYNNKYFLNNNKKIFKLLFFKFTKKIREYLENKKVENRLKKILKKNEIPVIICSYNRLYYLKKLINQFNKLSIKPIILDNNSDEKNLLRFYNNNKNKNFFLIKLFNNYGHNVIYEKFIYKNLPQIFAYTDPDISLNKKLKKGFLFFLKSLTEKYKIHKAGFAIDINSVKKIKLRIGYRNKNKQITSKYVDLKKYEKDYWQILLQKNPNVYKAKIDTTFAVYNKKYKKSDRFDGVRVANQYTCKHLPWEKKNKEPISELNYYKKKKRNDISATIY